MTILALQVRAPDVHGIHSEAELLAALVRQEPPTVTFLMSFLTLGIYWIGQQTLHSLMAAADHYAALLHLVMLVLIVVLPFSTNLLTKFIAYRTALLVYWLNVALLGAAFLAAWNYAAHARLLKPQVDAQAIASIRRRALVSECLYAFGAALCVFGTAWSIGFIFLVQLSFIIVPPSPWLRRPKA